MPFCANGACCIIMKFPVGIVFRIQECNLPIDGCTVSEQIHVSDPEMIVFSLAKDTDISPEIYADRKFIIVHTGDLTVISADGTRQLLRIGDCEYTPSHVPVGASSEESCVYSEITFRRGSVMNSKILTGEVFRLNDLVPYADGKIVNMDIARNDKMKFVIMAFDAGTGLTEHAAPGEALILALDGEGVIGYEGQEYTLHAGDNFKFAKAGKHYVKAIGRFKMALLLMLD